MNMHLNLILNYQYVYDSLLTKLPGRMKRSPLSQHSNEPVTMEMSMLTLPAPRRERCSGAAPGKLAVRASGTWTRATLSPAWGGQAAAHPTDTARESRQAPVVSRSTSRHVGKRASLFLQGHWFLLGSVFPRAPGAGSARVRMGPSTASCSL